MIFPTVEIYFSAFEIIKNFVTKSGFDIEMMTQPDDAFLVLLIDLFSYEFSEKRAREKEVFVNFLWSKFFHGFS